MNLNALNSNLKYLTTDAKQTVYYFQKIINGNLYERIFFLFKSGINRQTFIGKLTLFIATFLKKM